MKNCVAVLASFLIEVKCFYSTLCGIPLSSFILSEILVIIAARSTILNHIMKVARRREIQFN